MTNNFALLLNDNTRDDDYVNATKLCQNFDKDLYEYKRLPSTKKFVKALQNKVSGKIPVIDSKRGQGTWVHPLVAIDLAEWLSPEFAVFVKRIFKGVMDAEVAIAESIVERTEDIEGLERLTTASVGRTKQLKAYHNLHNTLKDLGCEDVHHATVNKTNNLAIGIETRQNGIDKRQTQLLTIYETMEEMKLSEKPVNNAWHAVNRCKKTAREVTGFLNDQKLLN